MYLTTQYFVFDFIKNVVRDVRKKSRRCLDSMDKCLVPDDGQVVLGFPIRI